MVEGYFDGLATALAKLNRVLFLSVNLLPRLDPPVSNSGHLKHK